MSVAKRQRREKPAKIEQKKVQGPELGPQVKETALLASTVYTRQPQGRRKIIKRGAKIDPGPLFSLPLLGRPMLMLWECILHFLPNKNELWNGALTLVHPLLQIFTVAQEKQWSYKLPWQTYDVLYHRISLHELVKSCCWAEWEPWVKETCSLPG